MRPIKFRAWDTARKEWGDIGRYGTFQFDPETGGFFTIEGPDGETWTEDVPDGRLIAEQFTGLHDKNGREIYEGDIVFNPDSYFKGVVIWDQENCGFRLNDWHIDWYDSDDRRGYEVIGNIHETPELLK